MEDIGANPRFFKTSNITMGYYSATRKEWNNAICCNMDGPRGSHTKWSDPDRQRQVPCDTLTCVIYKGESRWTYLQNRNDSDTENKLTGTKEEGGTNQASGTKRYPLLQVKQIGTSKGLPHSLGLSDTHCYRSNRWEPARAYRTVWD